ncbi:MAG TPA: hypothetical protein VFZ58_05935 [Candidatus Saccharimonadales bacterium]
MSKARKAAYAFFLVFGVGLVSLSLGELTSNIDLLLIGAVLLVSLGMFFAAWYFLGGGRDYRRAHRALRLAVRSLGFKASHGRRLFTVPAENICIAVTAVEVLPLGIASWYFIERIELGGERRAYAFISRGTWLELHLDVYGEGVILREDLSSCGKYFTEIFSKATPIERTMASIESIEQLTFQLKACEPILA